MVAFTFRPVLKYLDKRQTEIREAIQKDNLWKRMIRVVVATTLAVSITLIHYDTVPAFGKGAYLAAMVTLFVHPGRRVGQLIEVLVLALIGLVLGVSWAVFGLWLGSLVIHTNPQAGYAIRAVFLVIALFFHGFMRAHFPRAFLMVLVFIIATSQGLTTTAKDVSISQVTNIVYPVLLASAIILFANTCILPEFSSAFLGKTTISSLDAIADSLRKSGSYFVGAPQDAVDSGAHPKKPGSKELQKDSMMSNANSTLSDITAAKKTLRDKLTANKNAQNETQFEIAISHLPPYRLGPISKKAMQRLVTQAIAMIGCCETRFALLGDENAASNTEKPRILVRTRTGLGAGRVDLARLKAKKEIEFGDVKLLKYLFNRIRSPYISFQTSILQSIEVVKSCVAYAYDVPGPFSETHVEPELRLSQLNKQCDEFLAALQQFDNDITATLEGAASLQEMKGEGLDIMPREEIFLVASFLLSVRQAATQISEMLNCAKLLVQQRSEASSWRRVIFPRIRWRKWLYTGGESDDGNPPGESRTARQREKKDKADSAKSLRKKTVDDVETAVPDRSAQDSRADHDRAQGTHEKQIHMSTALFLRNKLADLLEWIQHSEDVIYSFKLTLAAFLVTFPAFTPSLNAWYAQNRGSWAALQLIFVFDVAIGTSIQNAYLRAIGTTLGSFWGWAANSARGGNPVVCAVMIFIGLIPSSYVQLGSKYTKAGTVTMVSMCVVALATELQTIPGTSTQNFLSRWLAFLVGSFMALFVEITVLPVKARSRLVESLAVSIRRIGEMESYLAYGIEDPVVLKKGFPMHVFERFDKVSNKAKLSLDDAKTFLPFCSSEPRLKGSFKKIAKVYEEIIFVLQQIVDKMDNMLQLRMAYGAGPLEEFGSQIRDYRQNVAGSVYMILYATHEALTTKYPLPQFIPSARLAQLRLVNRVREVVQDLAAAAGGRDSDKRAVTRILRRKYMSWSAASAAQIEIIEYLEELTDLTKLLVGANEFKSGLLARPTLQQYAKGSDVPARVFPLPELALEESNEEKHDDEDDEFSATKAGVDPLLPISLQRIQSRKQEAGARKRVASDARYSSKSREAGPQGNE